jgi:hypothetical protein
MQRSKETRHADSTLWIIEEGKELPRIFEMGVMMFLPVVPRFDSPQHKSPGRDTSTTELSMSQQAGRKTRSERRL